MLGSPVVDHPLLACAATVSQAVKDAATVDPIFMTPQQKRDALVGLSAAADQLEILRLGLLASAEETGDVAEASAARSAAAWLADQTRREGAKVRYQARLGRSLDRWPSVRAAVADQSINLGQAEAILYGLDELVRLAPDLDPDIRQRAVEHLLMEASRLDPRQLRYAALKILEVVAPEVADEHDRRRLEDQEAHARRRTFLRSRRNGDGTTDIHLRLADAIASRLLRYLHSFTNPRRQESEQPAQESPFGRPAGSAPSGPYAGGSAPDDRRPHDQRMGEAFGSMLEAMDPDRMPVHGGDATTVVVTIDLETLRSELAGVGFVGDEPISADQVRRLACNAQIVPAVLGGDSEVLDLGRAKRLYDHKARRAKAVQFPVCQAAGCDIPSAWCEGHHRVPWSQGGRTDLADLVLLCSFHHHRAHDHRYDTTYGPDGVVTLRRRM